MVNKDVYNGTDTRVLDNSFCFHNVVLASVSDGFRTVSDIHVRKEYYCHQ